jgi:YD repeat-containing protein
LREYRRARDHDRRSVAQQRTVCSTCEREVVGRSATDSSGTTTTHDARGNVVGRETTTGNTMTIYDARGHLPRQARRAAGQLAAAVTTPLSCARRHAVARGGVLQDYRSELRISGTRRAPNAVGRSARPAHPSLPPQLTSLAPQTIDRTDV